MTTASSTIDAGHPDLQLGPLQRAAEVGLDERCVAPGEPQTDQPAEQRDGLAQEAAHEPNSIDSRTAAVRK